MHKGDVEIEMQPTLLEKDLGVYIDPKLTFSSHCEQKVNKANKILRRSYVHYNNNNIITCRNRHTSVYSHSEKTLRVIGKAPPGIWQCVMVSHLQER